MAVFLILLLWLVAGVIVSLGFGALCAMSAEGQPPGTDQQNHLTTHRGERR